MNNNRNQNTGSTNIPRLPQYPTSEKTIKDHIISLRRGKWWIVLITLVVFIAGMFLTFQQEPLYQAETSVILYNGGGQQENFISDIRGQQVANIYNEIEILKSRMLAEKVAKSILQRRYLDQDSTKLIPSIIQYDEGRNIGVASLGTITNRVQRNVSFEHLPNTDIILVSARSREPEEAALLSQTYAEIYYERNHQTSRAQSKRVREFLENQLRERERQLQQAENRLQNYMEQHGVVTIDRESQKVIDQIAALEARREELNVEIASRKQTLALLREQLEEHEPGVTRTLGSADDSYIRMLQEQIAQLEVERDQIVAYNPEITGQDKYRSIINRLKSLRETLDRRTQDYMRELTPGDEGYIRQLMQRLLEGDVELQGLQLRKAATDSSIREYEKQFEQLPRINMDFARLQRGYQSAEQLYLFIEQKYNESLIAEESEFGTVGIIDPALVPNQPFSPNVKQSLLQAFIFGLGLGIAFVLIKEHMGGKISTPEEVRKRGYHLLSSISDMTSDVKRISRNGTPSFYGQNIDSHIISAVNPMSPISESFRWLRTNINFELGDEGGKTLLITSPNPGEGKSTTTTNLAATYAQAGERVLLIDTDIRMPVVHTMLDVPAKPGLTNILFGEVSSTDAIQRTVIENLDVLTCGSTPQNPASIYGTQLGWLKMKALIDSLKKRYDVIIFDSAPIMAASDPSVIASFVDGVIVVVSSEITKFGDMEVTEESIQTVGGKFLGIVVNRFNYKYGHSYAGKYYNYGSYGRKRNGENGNLLKKKIKKDVS